MSENSILGDIDDEARARTIERADTSSSTTSSPLNHHEHLVLPHQMPVVLLVGPHNIGKTAILSSLIQYTTEQLCPIPDRHRLYWTVCESVLSDTPNHYKAEAGSLLSRLGDLKDYIGSTNNYFLLNAAQKERPCFTLLETQGEDYFSRETRKILWPLYLQDLVQRSIKKVYVFVFSHDIFSEIEPNLRRQLIEGYDQAVADFIRLKIKQNRDKFLILYTKVDGDPSSTTGVTEREAANSAFSSHGLFKKTGEAFRNSTIKDKRIIAYSSGPFIESKNGMGHGRTKAPPEYAKALAEALMVQIKGKSFFGWLFKQ